MKTFSLVVAIIAGFFALSVIGTVLGIISLPFHAASNIVDTGHSVIDNTLNADNAIYNYEWFKQQKLDIETTKGQYQNALQTEDAFTASAGDRSKWMFDDKQEAARLSSVTLGLKNQIIQRTNDYNARASMANRDIFRDGVLPNIMESGFGILK